jgi:hypothetical protein
MKKTTMKKLVLAKETVRALNTAGLEQAQGGSNPYWSIQGGCIVSQRCSTMNTNNETQ